MILAERIALNLTALGFVLLGVATALEWYRHRNRAAGMLALSLGSLAVVAALGRIQDLVGQSAVLGIVTIVAFVASGYFVLLFRDAFLPLRPRTRQWAMALFVFACGAGIADVTFLAHAGSGVMTVAAAVLIGAWAIFTGEPIARFWIASRKLPSVQKARMRFLSFGFAVLIVILVVDVFGGGAAQSPQGIIATQLIALAIVPVIYVSFAPPGLLRRIWRMGEEAELRSAIQDLLIFSPTRQELAEKAAGWRAYTGERSQSSQSRSEAAFSPCISRWLRRHLPPKARQSQLRKSRSQPPAADRRVVEGWGSKLARTANGAAPHCAGSRSRGRPS